MSRSVGWTTTDRVTIEIIRTRQWNVEFTAIVFNISYIAKCRTKYNSV